MSSPTSLVSLLNKYKSLIEMAPKVPARDKESLSLVYTPGVAQACKTIQDNPEEIYNLTNKANSILLITDGSEEPAGDSRNYHLLPYLETLAIFYKELVNIDAYPLLLDRERVKSPEFLFEVLDNLTPGFAGFELRHFEASRVEKVQEFEHTNSLKALVFVPSVRAQLDAVLADITKNDVLKNHTIAAGFLRAALDCQVYSLITSEAITKFAEGIAKHKELLEKDNFYQIAIQATFEAATVFAGLNLAKNKKISPEEVKTRLEMFYIEGSESWLRHTCFDYLDERHGYKDNAVELHRVHIGVTNVKPKLNFRDISEFRHLFDKKNLDDVRDFIMKDPARNAYDASLKNNLCAIITNGTAILGLGDIGSEAGMPVMEGKSVLFKQLAGVDVVPMGIKEKKDDNKAVKIIAAFGHTFAGINLEDIKAPSCFHIETGLQKELDIPVFHDDQHGTAVVAAAALLNSLRLANKKIEDIKIVVNGAGAAGEAITRLFLEIGAKNIVMCDTKGAIYSGRPYNMNDEKEKIAKITNLNKEEGSLADVLKGSDVFLGVSVGGVLTKEMVKTMNEKPIIFAFANPEPEIMPDDAREAGAFIIATGRSDFANQVNNSLAFPGIFRGAIDIRASSITTNMKTAAAQAIAKLVSEKELNPEFIIPGALDYRVPLSVATEVVKVGMKEGNAIREVDLELYKEHFKYFVLHGAFNPAKELTRKKENKIGK